MKKDYSLTEKENALRVLNRSGDPEWVPIAEDCLQVVFSSEDHERPHFGTDGDDWFGCSWIFDNKAFGHAPDLKKPYVLQDITKWHDVVKFPDLDSIDWVSAAERDLTGINRDEKLLRFFMMSGPLERSHHLMGFENFFIALCEEPEDCKELIAAIGDYKIKIIEKIAETYKPDEIFFQDDLGTARGPMISLEMYYEFVKPVHKKIGEKIRSYGIHYTHHSCGYMENFIDDFIDNGVTMINPIQPMNNHKEIISKYKGKVCFNTGADSYLNYPDSREEDIRQEVRDIIDNYATSQSLIYDCFLSNMDCIKNKEITLDEARKYGKNSYK